MRLYLRVRLPDGSHPYLAAAYASNGWQRPHTATYKGKPAHFPDSTYHLRYQLDGRRVWQAVGNDPSTALVSLQRKTHELLAVALGLESQELEAPFAAAPPSDQETEVSSKRVFKTLMETYIAETKEHKSVKILAAYERTLKSFKEIIQKEYVEGHHSRRHTLLGRQASRKRKRSSHHSEQG